MRESSSQTEFKWLNTWQYIKDKKLNRNQNYTWCQKNREEIGIKKFVFFFLHSKRWKIQLLQITRHIFPSNMWSLDQHDWILFIEIMVHVNHRAQILQCQQVFVLFFSTCKTPTTTPLHCLTWVQSDPGRETKVTMKPSKKKKKRKETTNPFWKKKRQNHHAAMRAQINSCHVKSYKQDTKSCHAQFLHLRARGLLGLYVAAKKRKTADKAADLLCFALLPGISCFDSA